MTSNSNSKNGSSVSENELITSWPPEGEAVTSWPTDWETITSWPPLGEAITSWPPDGETITSWPPLGEAITSWPPDGETITSWPPEGEAITSWPPENESVTSCPPEKEATTSWPPEEEAITSWPPKGEAITSWPPEGETISSWPPDCKEKNSIENDKYSPDNNSKSSCLSTKEIGCFPKPDKRGYSKTGLQEARIALAIWFRRWSKLNNLDLPPGLGASSRINYLATTLQGRQFLLEEISKLHGKEKENTGNLYFYYVMATFYDLNQDKLQAFYCILKSLKLLNIKADFLESLDIKEYLKMIKNFEEDERNCVWLFCKLKLQLNTKTSNNDSKTSTKDSKISTKDYKISTKLTVNRVNSNDLTIEQFKMNYCEKNLPVVISDLRDVISGPEWTLKYISDVCGSKNVSLKVSSPHSTEWAGLENQTSMTKVCDYLETLAENNLYLFDWSLPLNASELAAKFNLPQYFWDNILLKTNPGAMYRESWPSLFIGAKGTGSGLHVDAFGSHFYMYLISGKKRWTFYPADSLSELKPVYWDSLDPTFSKDLDTSSVKCFTVDLCGGELLFVPAGCPHTVHNLEDSIAVSGNFVNETNKHLFKTHIKINALKDPRSQDLLQEMVDLDLL